MNPISLRRIKPEVYRRWLDQSSTQRLLALESEWLRSWVSQLYGTHLAYTGVDPTPHFLKYSKSRHTFKFGFSWSESVADYNALLDSEHWPFADGSLDVIILQHSLDMSSNPHQFLREASRSLGAGGYLVVLGFNPYSLWGAWRWMHSFSSKLPWLAQPLSKKRIKDWLTLLDMHVEHTLNCAHLWPVSIGSEQMNKRIDRVVAGTSWLPSNAYLLLARKTIAGFTPIRQNRETYYPTRFGLAATASSTALPTLKNERQN